MSRPVHARINLSALDRNLDVVRRHAPHAKMMAVVKANAYGHGLMRVVQVLQEADGLAVLALDEGIALREGGYRRPILLLEGFFGVDELLRCAEHHLSAVVHCREQVEMLMQTWLPIKVDVFLKMNSGMNRLGFKPDDFRDALAELKSCRTVGNIVLMTHFANADESAGIASQFSLFNATSQGLAHTRCLANSAAILRYPDTHAEWVRPGIMLYGSSPFSDKTAEELGLQPVMTLASQIIGIQQLHAGDSVGYGSTFVAERDMRVGVVACGYADGYPRHAPTGTPVLVEGKRTRTLGRVSMDMLCVDLTDIAGAKMGSNVTLWGDGLPVDDVARAAGTISYELLCALAPRVPVIDY